MIRRHLSTMDQLAELHRRVLLLRKASRLESFARHRPGGSSLAELQEILGVATYYEEHMDVVPSTEQDTRNAAASLVTWANVSNCFRAELLASDHVLLRHVLYGNRWLVKITPEE